MAEHRPERGQPADRIYEATAPLERTALSWNRSLLALAVNGALLARVGQTVGLWATVVGGVILLIALASWLFTSRAYRRSSGRPTPILLARRRQALLLTVLAVFVGLVDLVAIASYP